MGWLTAAELVTKTRYSEAVQQQVAKTKRAAAKKKKVHKL